MNNQRFYVETIGDLPDDLYPRTMCERSNKDTLVFGVMYSEVSTYCNWSKSAFTFKEKKFICSLLTFITLGKSILKHLKELTHIDTKKNYTTHTFNSYKNNIKKTWKTINDTLGRGRNQSKLPTSIVDNGKKVDKS